jgi:uncharacterized protein YfiM (DUF2279 family)
VKLAVGELLRIAILLAAVSAAPPEVQPAAPGHIIQPAPPPTPGVPRVQETGVVALPQADAWLGSDKFQHFAMSYAAAAFAYAGVRAAGADGDAALRLSIGAAAAAGVGKEVRDRRRGGIFSVRDLVADAFGLGAAYLLLREVR